MLGEALYPKIQALERNHAGKITGMLLEMVSADYAELLRLVDDPDALKAKVKEAMDVLKVCG